MARTKQTARKDTGGKPLAMGRGKKLHQRRILPQGSQQTGRWWWSILLMKNPNQTEGAAAPKRVKKQIHLTLPTSPAHVTTTESFTDVFHQSRAYSSPAEGLCQTRLEH